MVQLIFVILIHYGMLYQKFKQQVQKKMKFKVLQLVVGMIIIIIIIILLLLLSYYHYIIIIFRAHLEGKSVATRSLHRTILMYGFHLLVLILCTKNVKDTQCGFKLFTRNTARQLFQDLHLERWSFDIELIYVAEMLSIPLIEVIFINFLLLISFY